MKKNKWMKKLSVTFLIGVLTVPCVVHAGGREPMEPRISGVYIDAGRSGNNMIIFGWCDDGDGRWSYYKDDMEPARGWEMIDDKWYYFGEDGYTVSGWQWINGSWYYMNEWGVMTTGWQFINGSWYYMNGSGAMTTGWQFINGSWYYMNGSGAMTTGWQFINGSWYYMNGSGAMAVNTWIGNSYVNGSGVWEA